DTAAAETYGNESPEQDHRVHRTTSMAFSLATIVPAWQIPRKDEIPPSATASSPSFVSAPQA
ncbi:hypothetical protein Droror1_Dr00023621, partial [Drosera rotundifolia]